MGRSPEDGDYYEDEKYFLDDDYDMSLMQAELAKVRVTAEEIQIQTGLSEVEETTSMLPVGELPSLVRTAAGETRRVNGVNSNCSSTVAAVTVSNSSSVGGPGGGGPRHSNNS